ncbi:uncharacterized protein LOC106646864 [Copidosoma floridanum]|uniref:uncharacterized protein LOC106646864 n=1 Tax=Copidosoma floridanum TaxID=29053 RepID=UPI0006C9CC4B|nr:uncharacterized protein LOC106646864 [Copidosoma floridanum]
MFSPCKMIALTLILLYPVSKVYGIKCHYFDGPSTDYPPKIDNFKECSLLGLNIFACGTTTIIRGTNLRIIKSCYIKFSCQNSTNISGDYFEENMCCDTDYCNSAFKMETRLFILSVCLVFISMF